MLPNFIIIGAMKSGTTSLHYYLNFHPQVSMSKVKELDFFIEEKNWHKGLAWYTSNFTGESKKYGESSVNYTTFPHVKNVPQRMSSIVPEAKLIYVLRDPVERIVSHYIHSYANGNENRSFAKAILDTDCEYLCRSKYYMQLEQFLNYYPESRILVITQEDLYSNRHKTLQKIFRFLGIDDTFSSSKFTDIMHRSNDKRLQNKRIKRPVPDKMIRKELIGQLQEDVDLMRAFTGRDFENWCL